MGGAVLPETCFNGLNVERRHALVVAQVGFCYQIKVRFVVLIGHSITLHGVSLKADRDGGFIHRLTALP